MHLIVCVKQLSDGQLNPFDASALEMALSVCKENDHITLLCMGRKEAYEMLSELTRLGNVEGVLLNDSAFAGADTFVTAATLGTWLKQQEFDYIICGRQSIDGETAQVGPELAQYLQLPLVSGIMEIQRNDSHNTLYCRNRAGEKICAAPKALLMVERSVNLRFPSLWSNPHKVTSFDRETLKIPQNKCGLKGSPTQVINSYEKENLRHCHRILPEELPGLLEKLRRQKTTEPTEVETAKSDSTEKLKRIWITDLVLQEQAQKLAYEVVYVEDGDTETLAERVKNDLPDAILFPADWDSRNRASRLAMQLQTGLCADCTGLLVEQGELHMIRPAFGGRLYAKIRCRIKPAMATVRTLPPDGDRETLIFSIGKGALPWKQEIMEIADKWQGSIAASRGSVEMGEMPYEYQVGLTGKTVAPEIYVMLGISGAVHHMAGMESSRTVIAVNMDPEAYAFNFADYGIVASVQEVLQYL